MTVRVRATIQRHARFVYFQGIARCAVIGVLAANFWRGGVKSPGWWTPVPEGRIRARPSP